MRRTVREVPLACLFVACTVLAVVCIAGGDCMCRCPNCGGATWTKDTVVASRRTQLVQDIWRCDECRLTAFALKRSARANEADLFD